MKMKMIGVAAALLLLGACSSPPPPAAAPGAPYGAPGPSAGAGAITPGSEAELRERVGDRVYFEFDRSDISAEAQQILERQAAWLKHYPNVAVRIEGHCDARGTRAYNLALGERRAHAAMSVLVALGTAPSRIATISYGKDRPIVLGSSERAYALNRVAITRVR
jgi:peptidoglycan-associated lipoprotein